MRWNKYSYLKDAHAFLGGSQFSWINYDDEKLIDKYYKAQAVKRGTQLHELAYRLIKMNQTLPREELTLNMYVNDAIGFRMKPEQILFYSENCFGTADAISFHRNTLRIHDLKTGTTPAHIEQLMVYAALFCLEYKKKPAEINIELRIYQNNEVLCHEATAEDIAPIMDKIIHFDKMINEIKDKEREY